MSKKNKTPTLPEPTETPNVPAVKITGKTKFAKYSVEATTIREVKKREKKIIATGKSLVGLWLAQGKEILEFLEITEVSQRVASELLSVKRTSLNTYVTIASDPRMISGDFSEALENFSQKDLIKLSKIDDEEVFDKAMRDGELPKAERDDIIDVDVEDVDDIDEKKPTWQDLAHIAVDNATSIQGLLDTLTTMLDVTEMTEIDMLDYEALINEAIELTGEDNPTEQANAIGLKKSIFKKALAGEMSEKTLETVRSYINS